MFLMLKISEEAFLQLESGGEFRSTDEQAGVVAKVLAGARLPNPQPFTSCAVWNEPPPSTHSANAYGEGRVSVYLRLDAVASSIVLAAGGDIQTVAANHRRSRRLPIWEIDGDLDRVLKLALRSAPPDGYAEIRIGRPIGKDDIERCDLSGSAVLQLKYGSDWTPD